MLKITIESGKLIVIAGASQSGKTTYVERETRTHKRIIAWDPEDQFSQLAGYHRITTPKGLLEATQSPSNLKLAYVASANLKENFNFFCGCAFRWGWKLGACTVIAEELSDVTTTAKAPDKWGILIRRGLKRGISIFSISQRWAEADKTSIGNASEFVCFRMNGDDIPYMARKTRIPINDLEGLNSLEYVRYIASTKQTIKGKLKINKKT